MPVARIVPAAATRRTATPNATMTTLASPTLGATAGLSVWRVEMAAGSAGPPHVVDTEQVWTVVDGTLQVEAGGAAHTVAAGDTVVLPAGAERRVRAPGPATALVVGHGDAQVHVPGEPTGRGTPPWIA